MMNDIPTNAEIIFLIALLAIAIVVILLIRQAVADNEMKRMLGHYDYEEYHDDMEDRG